ncbi:hypothetical protein KIF59_19125 [Enterobacter cloacae subsp. cloacae]|nr:hypothetical protein [Enterobacter cloacae subsp. cloacae]
MFGPLRRTRCQQRRRKRWLKNLLAKVASQNVLTTTLLNFPVGQQQRVAIARVLAV